MTDVSDGQWRWPLPDDWEPTGFWCVQITIPGDQQYFDRLTGALGLLTLSKSWFPDPTREGPKTVAHTWENALYLNMFSVTPDCAVVPTPPIPNADAAADASAAIFTVFMSYLATQINACASTVGDCAGCVDGIMTDLAPYGASDAVRGALNRLCQDMVNSPDLRADFETECPYVDEFNAIKDKINDNPYDWLNKLSQWLFDWLNQTSSTILQDLNTVAGLLGGGGIQGFINDNGGIPSGGGADFGGTCPWIAHLDLTADPWYAEADPVDATFGWTALFGQWTNGVGWEATDADRTPAPGERARLVHLLFTFPWSFSITKIQVKYNLTKGSYDPLDLHWQYQSVGFGSSYSGTVWNGDDPDGTDKIEELVVSGTSDTAHVFLTAHHVHDGSALGGSCVATELIIYGTGTNPFA